MQDFVHQPYDPPGKARRCQKQALPVVKVGFHDCQTTFWLLILGGSWVVISRVVSRVTILITHITGLIALLITYNYP